MDTALKPGEVIDGFKIVRVLGQGSSSEVALATAPDDRQVVLKLPRDAAVASPSAFDRFRRELEIDARLSHPGIQGSIDYRHGRSRPYLVMEYIDGETLAELLGRERRLPVDRAVAFAIQIATAMGNLADGTPLLLPPEELPRITAFIIDKLCENKMHVYAGDDIGYYDANEPCLRTPVGVIALWPGCQAGLRAVGIDSVGNVKG